MSLLPRWQESYELVEDIVDEDYGWQAVGVFRMKSNGKLFWAMDGGCSCYSPWEDDDLTITPLDWDHLQQFRNAVSELDILWITRHNYMAKMSALVPR